MPRKSILIAAFALAVVSAAFLNGLGGLRTSADFGATPITAGITLFCVFLIAYRGWTWFRSVESGYQRVALIGAPFLAAAAAYSAYPGYLTGHNTNGEAIWRACLALIVPFALAGAWDLYRSLEPGSTGVRFWRRIGASPQASRLGMVFLATLFPVAIAVQALFTDDGPVLMDVFIAAAVSVSIAFAAHWTVIRFADSHSRWWRALTALVVLLFVSAILIGVADTESSGDIGAVPVGIWTAYMSALLALACVAVPVWVMDGFGAASMSDSSTEVPRVPDTDVGGGSERELS